MLALKVRAPADRIFEAGAVRNSLFENPDTLGVRKAYKLSVGNTFKAADEFVVVSVVEELDVVHAIVKRMFHKVFDEFFGKVHIVLDVVECHFRLNHPKLCQVARSI